MLESLTRSRWSPGRRRRVTLTGLVAASTLATSVVYVNAAAAAVPTFPDNIVVFPDRDFLALEGYEDFVDETVTIEVSRPGAGIIGATQGTIVAGDPALEVNHPGGVCWGAGTGVNVTPDIQPGDQVILKLGDRVLGDATTQDAYVSAGTAGPASELDGTTLVVRGHVGAGVNRAQFEQRIVNPDLTPTDVARRDVRATTPEFTRAAKGGYDSKLEFSGDTFTATYRFDNAETARIAAAGQLRVLTWQEEDADANRQGLTIAEFGEAGGPGMGGCPNGPLQAGPPAPSNVTAVRAADGTSIKLTWTPAAAVPGTPAILGYRVVAVAATTNANSEQVEIGRRIGNPGATGTTITGLTPAEAYTVELRSVTDTGETNPAATIRPLDAGEDTTAPTAAASPAGGSFAVPQTVTLTANEAGSELYYSLTGADLIEGDELSTDPSVTRYTGPFQVTQSSTVTFVAFDPSGNISEQGEQRYTITNDPVPAAPTFTGTPTAGPGSVALTWAAPDPGAAGLTITGYSVRVYDVAGGTVGSPRTVDGTVTNLVVDGLSGDTAYLFTVRAQNVNGYGPESAKVGPVTAHGALVANAGADRFGVVRNTRVTLDGSGSTRAGVTYAWTQVLTGTTDPDRVTLTGASSVNPSFTLPSYAYPMTNDGLTFRLTVRDSAGAVRTDDVRVMPQPDRVTIATGRYRAGTELRLDGTGSTVGATITIRSGSPAGPVVARVPVTAAAPPEVGGEWTLRLRANAVPATNQPLYIESTHGGTAGPFTPGR